MSAVHASLNPSRALADPEIRQIDVQDLARALRQGYDDFLAMPSHLLFIGLLYPILGLVLASVAFGYDLLPLVYPLISGFALVGPIAGIGLYELSRRREAGLQPSWSDAFTVLQSPALGSVIGLGAILVAVFLLWLGAAQTIYATLFGSGPVDYSTLVTQILTTPRGWALILIGNAVGGAFAALVLLISVIGFPIILDRHARVGEAVAISARAVMANPRTMALWGAIVTGLLILGSIPLFVGLAVVMPILGHATWHLYRAVVGP